MGTGYKKKDKSISSVLPDLLQHRGWQNKLDLHSFFPKWEKVVNESVAGCSRPVKIVKDVLILEVENSTWMQQLQYEKFQILEDINSTLRHSRIRDIKFVLPKDEEKVKTYELPPVTFISPDPKALSKFEEQVSIIKDDSIREALVRLWYLTKACKRSK